MNTTSPKIDCEFIPATQLASHPDSTWLPWRIDASGEQWFRRVSAIHGVPPVAPMAAPHLLTSQAFEDSDQ